jgi:DNA (cytosine-5)-methyltransferase 1
VTLTMVDFFCGAGGSSQGAAAVPGVALRLAANHWDRAIASHAANFPHADHWQGDIHDADAARFPAADLFWASPECPQWSQARGTRRDFDRQPDLFGEVLPDPAAVIDWTDPGTRIGDRTRPMREATRARIAAGLARYARPVILETTWHDKGPGTRVHPAENPLTTLTAQPTKALACPPLIVPAGGTWRAEPAPTTVPFTARTTRENDGVAFPPDAAMIVRNYTPRGDPGQMATPVAEPLRTLTAAGNQSLATWTHLLVPYYGRATTAQPVTLPAGTMPTHDRYGLATGTPSIPVDDVLFRMLKPAEIGRAMAFGDGYTVLGTNREKVRQYGNAVTPPVAEILISALVEAIAPGQAREAA